MQHVCARRGFTLIETLVAVTILTLSVVAPLYVADRVLVASQTSRDQLTASYLAQEGIEYLRSMRDHEFLAARQVGGANVSVNAWSNFISGSGQGSVASCRSQTCTLDPTRQMGTGSGLALVPCSDATCAPLYLSGAVYTEQPIGTQTLYTRTVQAVLVADNDIRITSIVRWSSRGTTYTVSIRDHLTPWQ